MLEGIWQDVVVQIHNIRIFCVLVVRALIFPYKTKNCVSLAIKQLPCSPTSENSKEIDYFEVVLLPEQQWKHVSSLVTNF